MEPQEILDETGASLGGGRSEGDIVGRAASEGAPAARAGGGALSNLRRGRGRRDGKRFVCLCAWPDRGAIPPSLR
jgi:hypothetical protein